MRIVRKIALSLFAMLMVTALLLAGFFAPARIFEIMDRSKETQIFYQELDAVDLTLTRGGSLFERMNLLTLSNSEIKYYTETTQSTEDDISIAVLLFLDTMCWYAGIEMADTIETATILPLLYINEQSGQSAIFWECSFRFPEEDVHMLLTVDDISRKVTGLYMEDLDAYSQHTKWSPGSLAYAVQQALDATLTAENPVWTDNLNESTPYQERDEYSIGYQQCTLYIREDEDYYRYTMCMVDTALAFNHPMCGDLKAFHGGTAEYYNRGEDIS